MRFRLLTGTFVAIDPKVPRPTLPDKAEAGETRDMFEKRCARVTEDWERRATRIYAARGIKERIQQRVARGDEDPKLLQMLASATDVIESDFDLTRLFDAKDKFERIVEGTSTDDGLLHQKPNETVEEFIARIQAMQAAASAIPVAEPPATDITDTYESMTVDQLKQHASEEEVDLGPARTKKEIIAVLRGAVVSSA